MKHPKKSVKALIQETNNLFLQAKNENINDRSLKLQDSLMKCEKAYDMYLSLDEKDNEEQFKLEFNLAALYLLSNENKKCLYYLEKLKRNDMNKKLNEKKNKQLALIYAKLADNFRVEGKQENYEKILLAYKSSVEYFEKLNYSDKDDDDTYVTNDDFNLYCQILITIAKYVNVKYQIEESFIDKMISVCKSLDNDEIKAKIYSDLSTIIVRLSKDTSNFERAENLLKKALVLTNSENLFMKGIIFHNLGALYNRYCEYQKAIENLHKAVDTFDENKVALNVSLKKQLSDIYFNLGYAHAKMYRIDEAKDAFNLSIKHLEESDVSKNKWESLAALGTLSVMNNQENEAIHYYQNALEVHQAYVQKDATYLQIEKLLKNKIDGLKKRIKLSNSFKSINNYNHENTYENIDFLNVNTNDLKISTQIFNKMNMMKSDLSNFDLATVERQGSIKKGILKQQQQDDYAGKKTTAIIKKLAEKRKSVLFSDSLPSNSQIEMENTYDTIDTNGSSNNAQTDTNKLAVHMELSTKQPSGEFLEPVVVKKEELVQVTKSGENSDDEGAELRKSQRELFDNYIKNINDYEVSMDEKENSNTSKTDINIKNNNNNRPKKKIDVDVIERVDGSDITPVNNEIQPKKARSKICAIM